MCNEVVYSTETGAYQRYCSGSISKYKRRCIDGNIVGCGSCVAYCECEEHPGFLTKKLVKKHKCIEKKCDRYIPKSSPTKARAKKSDISDSELFEVAENAVKKYTGMKFIKTSFVTSNKVKLYYITISDEYPLDDIKNKIEEKSGYLVELEKLNYTFDNCVKILFES